MSFRRTRESYLLFSTATQHIVWYMGYVYSRVDTLQNAFCKKAFFFLCCDLLSTLRHILCCFSLWKHSFLKTLSWVDTFENTFLSTVLWTVKAVVSGNTPVCSCYVLYIFTVILYSKCYFVQSHYISATKDLHIIAVMKTKGYLRTQWQLNMTWTSKSFTILKIVSV